MARELHLELLLGKRVHDADGKPVGRIEEFRAEQQGGEWVLREYLVGSYGLFERLAAWSILRARSAARAGGAATKYGGTNWTRQTRIIRAPAAGATNWRKARNELFLAKRRRREALFQPPASGRIYVQRMTL